MKAPSRRVFRSKLLLQAVDLPKKDDQEINIFQTYKNADLIFLSLIL